MVDDVQDTPAGCEKGLEAIKLVCFTNAEHNGKTNAILKFVRSVKVRYQVVAGTMHQFTVKVKEAGSTKKLYKAKVWAMWKNFKQLQMPQSPDLRLTGFSLEAAGA
ncbi:hypothetical protein SORBI_3009G184500 [Sorghum bicolor]|uniref:Cysteine proteinase inhibitor n=1 Tax=Sorghum bicolor TaxID=4558 RepID=A0A1Z5R3Y5_SORBI|nr:hypothetical protein SORBI_3009G184500 [Sorghum bicolor]